MDDVVAFLEGNGTDGNGMELPYFELWSEASPLRHMWSLAIEEQFYLLWPVVVFGLLKALRGRTTLLIAGCVLAAAGSVVLMAELAETDRSRAYLRCRIACCWSRQ